MTDLRINATNFKAVCKRVRSYVEDDFNADDESIYSFYRWYMRSARKEFVGSKPAPTKSEMLRTSLVSASIAAGQYGASDTQINYIIALAEKIGDFNVLSGGRLTKREASIIINSMKG